MAIKVAQRLIDAFKARFGRKPTSAAAPATPKPKRVMVNKAFASRSKKPLRSLGRVDGRPNRAAGGTGG